MSTALAKKGTQVEIAELVSQGKITSPDQLVKKYKVTYSQAISLLSNPNFIALVAAFTKSRTQIAWHGKALPRIIEMIDHSDPKIALEAMKLLGKITEAVKGSDLNINVNLEAMVREFANSGPVKRNNPLGDSVIEAEFEKIMAEE